MRELREAWPLFIPEVPTVWRPLESEGNSDGLYRQQPGAGDSGNAGTGPAVASPLCNHCGKSGFNGSY